ARAAPTRTELHRRARALAVAGRTARRAPKRSAPRPAAAIAARRLRELGERGVPRGPRPKTCANPAGLTARELEVLGLLAEGLRNAQIAERLVLSGKTVDHHVSAVLRKLDVRSEVKQPPWQRGSGSSIHRAHERANRRRRASVAGYGLTCWLRSGYE
ncbi:MAG: helix-turn-helix transcriptional regulator, partial [Solirubrobacterales bacterium]|nr:helix-turn-helix transcriptional regulator [Solirubrobacterales bacterium]